MLTKIENLPKHVFGVRATDEVSADDLKSVLFPGLSALSSKYGAIYYLLVLDTKVENFTAGAWLQDMIAGIKHLDEWKKMAIVTDQKAVEAITDLVSYVIPGEAKGFESLALAEAINWVSHK